MRLAQFRQLSKKEQKQEVKKALIDIRKAGEKLNRLGTWSFPGKLNIDGSRTIWQRN